MNMGSILHTVEITGYASGGQGVARLADGRAAFVGGAARGDVCRVALTKDRRRYCEAAIKSILEPSARRVAPDCPAYGRCGGCVWRHVNYGEELYAKRERVKDALKRIGGFDVEPELIAASAGRALRYRNRAQFGVALRGGRAVSGFYSPGSREVAAVGDCLLCGADANAAARCVCGWIDARGISVYDQSTGAGLVRRVHTRSGRGGLTVCVSINGADMPYAGDLVERLKAACGNLSGVLLRAVKNAGAGAGANAGANAAGACSNQNYKNDAPPDDGCEPDADAGAAGEDGEYVTLWGSGEVCETIGDLALRMSPASFSQVNADGVRLLYDKAREYAALTREDFLLDLYCGAGATTLYLGRGAKAALGVECSGAAVADARGNALRNGVGNASFVCADASRFDARGLRPDCVSVDPPRRGLARGVIANIIEMAPARVVYISCEPSTMARDIKLLEGYAPQKACAVDMFPGTGGVECAALLIKNEN